MDGTPIISMLSVVLEGCRPARASSIRRYLINTAPTITALMEKKKRSNSTVSKEGFGSWRTAAPGGREDKGARGASKGALIDDE